MADMYSLLERARSLDDNTRNTAEQQLHQWELQNPGDHFFALSEVLKNESLKDDVRQLAGLRMKVSLDAQDAALKEERRQRWLSIPAPRREQIKNNVTATIAASGELARRATAQVIAKIGFIEITPDKVDWPALIPGLIQTAKREDLPPEPRSTSLTALSFLLEELDAYDESPLEQTDVDRTLEAICACMQLSAAKSLQSAAVSAMYTMLPFVALNFEEPARQGERDAIMMAICTSTTSEDVEVKRKAFLCVEKTAELYYEFLKSYMKVLADLTSVAARSSDEQIAVSAIGFWSEISNHEAEAEQGQDQGFTQAALTPLISMLTDIMSSALEETDGSDDVADNLVAEAAQACLQNVSGAVRDKVVDPIMTFINQNFLSPDWKKRDAAIMAFGCIMEGPDETLLRKNYIPGVLPHLAARLKGGASTDPSVTVRSSAAFTLANIFEHHAEVLDLKTQFLPILAGLCTALEDVPLVVVQVTRAIDNLVASCSQFEHWTTKVNGMEATIMSQALYPTINALISRADKPDAAESGIRKNSFNAISTIVDNGAEADNAVFLSLATDAVNRLNLSLQRLQAATSKEARELEINVQSGICGMLSDVIFKLQDKIWVQCDAIMGTLLHFLNAKAVAEDVWMCVGALSSTMPPPNSPEVAPAGAAAAAHVSIMRYIEPLWPLLMGYLKNWSEVEACGATIRATQFIVPAMGPALTQRAPELVTAVLAVLMDAQVDRILKPDALSTLGDIAQALGPAIHPYLPAMHSVIAGAAQFVSDSEDMQEYVNDIRTSCLEAWTYIIAAFSSTLDEAPAVKANKQNIAAQNLTSLAAVAPGQPGANLVNDIVAVILSWTVGWKAAEDGLNPDHVISAVALLGDLGCAVGPRVLQERQISCSRTPELVWLLSKAEDCERAKAEEEGDVFDKKNGKAYYARKYLPK